VIYAMKRRGGPRVDRAERMAEAGAFRCRSPSRIEMGRETTDAEAGCACAQRAVVTAPEQLWLQQLVSRTVGSSLVPLESVQWCAPVRRQHACIGADVASSAIGRKVPTSANNSRNLAVRRCMRSGESEPQVR
jgi:hypothetical protein